jgi:hypothetical protein
MSCMYVQLDMELYGYLTSQKTCENNDILVIQFVSLLDEALRLFQKRVVCIQLDIYVFLC